MTDSVLAGPSRAWHRLKTIGYASPLYRLTLGRGAPSGLAVALDDPWPGEVERGNALFQGRFRFAGHEAVAPNQPPWRLAPEQAEWTRALHDFAWLRHFRAAGGDAARQHARRLARSWIDLCGEWEPLIWDADVVARRIAAWIGHAGFLLEGADEHFRAQFLESLRRQCRHLGRAAGGAPPGDASLAVAGGLLLGTLAFDGRAARLGRGLALLERALAARVLADGGHASRAPSRQMSALRELIRLRAAFRAADLAAPAALEDAIRRMAPMLRAFRHGDGGLAVFNGGYEEEAAAVDATLTASEVDTPAPEEAPASGFQRLAAGRAIAIVDVGQEAGRPLGPEAHAGALGFEFSSGRERLVVNCGSGVGRDPAWGSALRVTAAHSALTVDDSNNMELPTGPGRPPKAPASGYERSRDDEGNGWLEARHEGYRQAFALSHRRRLYLGADGGDLRGEDRLLASADGAASRRACVRFHLHPEVRASLAEAGSQVLLRLPSGEGWRFRASGAEVALEESVYLGRRDAIRRSEQIVLRAAVEGPATAVKWAFRRA